MSEDNFQRPKNIEFQPEQQRSFDPDKTRDTPIEKKFVDEESTESTAAIVVEEYGKTIEFMKFIEGLLRDASKVEVNINPEDDPEVWMAMNRVFANPNTTINQNSYFEVIDALEVIEKLEQFEDNSFNIENELLDNIPNAQEVDEDEITEEDFQISAIDEIEEKAVIRRTSAFKDPPPPPPPPKPPSDENHPWLRRWRRYRKRINVLGRPYNVQWVKNRWWRRKDK